MLKNIVSLNSESIVGENDLLVWFRRDILLRDQLVYINRNMTTIVSSPEKEVRINNSIAIVSKDNYNRICVTI